LKHWSDLKRKLNQEGSQVYEKIVHLKMQTADGKYYQTDSVDTETMFRIIKAIPSPNADRLKYGSLVSGVNQPLQTSPSQGRHVPRKRQHNKSPDKTVCVIALNLGTITSGASKLLNPNPVLPQT
jgi:hypothetical protein